MLVLVEAYGYLKGPADMLQYYEGSYRRALSIVFGRTTWVVDAETNTKMVLFVLLCNHHHHNKEIKNGKCSTT